MVILIGLICLAIGISLAVNQWAVWLVTLQALISLGLLFWGVIFVLVGYSEMKARRDYANAVTPASVPDDSAPPKNSNSAPATSATNDATPPPANPIV